MIDRRRVVQRHNPRVEKLEPLSPITVGNGEFAFTADATGLQSFPEYYTDSGISLGTMSNWGWHSDDPGDLDIESYRWPVLDCNGVPRPFAYSARHRWFGHPPACKEADETNEALATYHTQNPHRWHLGNLGFCLNGKLLQPTDVDIVSQELDLWTGILSSRFRVAGKGVTVRTACHPDLDAIAVRVDTEAFSAGLQLVLRFGAASDERASLDWTRPHAHRSEIQATDNKLTVHRSQDSDSYTVSAEWSGSAGVSEVEPHQFVISPETGDRFEIVCGFFAGGLIALPGVDATFAATARAWEDFWCSGAAVDFTGSTDPRADELERRIVLSQYLTRTQSCGSLPPQETGLTFNSWQGKFHLEMHWWHAVHFPAWGRPELLERSLSWYQQTLPVAKDVAKRQGYVGARWPKQIGPEGRESPTSIGCFLIWQQPHLIYYAEQMYRTRPTEDTLDRYGELVEQTAAFMGDLPEWSGDRCHLEPMLIPMQENHSPFETRDPGFELAYWRFGLELAQRWRERRGISRHPDWDQVLAGLADLPQEDGVYLAHANCPATYTSYNHDHPAMLGMYGMIPGRIDPHIMRSTLKHTVESWHWDRAWGWDFPMAAMCAARLGDAELAVEILLMNCPKNRYLNNGHNWQNAGLPIYLPGNGGLLIAVAMMLGGWDDAGSVSLPDGWAVQAEGFNRCL